MSTEVLQKAIIKGKRKNSDDGTAEILKALSEKQKRSTRRKLERKMQETSIRRWPHESSSDAPPHRNRSSASGQVQTNCMPDNGEETGWVFVADDTGWIKHESFQTVFLENSHPLQGVYSILMAAEKAKDWKIPLFAALIDLNKSFDHVDRNKALKAMKKHRVVKQHLAWISKPWEQHRLQMRQKDTTSQENSKTTRGLPQSPVVSTQLVVTVPAALNKACLWKKRK